MTRNEGLVITDLQTSIADKNILKGLNLIVSDKMEKFYRNFKFSGSVFSLQDGDIFFPGEPIVRITSPLLEVNSLTAFLLNVFNYPILNFTKGVRIWQATAGRYLALNGARYMSFEQSPILVKTSFLLNAFPGVMPIFYKKFPDAMPMGGFAANINHAVIKSFPSEREAFRYSLDTVLPLAQAFSVMIDTYDIEQGIKIFIEELD